MVPVEQVINPNDSTIKWFRIPGFPGYEICNLNYVRSFKSRKKYPYGTLVKWDKNNTITLTNSNNQRVKLTLTDIWCVVKANPEITSYTWETQNTSRNQTACIDTEAISEVGKVVSKPKVRNSEEHKFV